MSPWLLLLAPAFAAGLAAGVYIARGQYSTVRLQVVFAIRREMLDKPVSGAWQTELAECLENIESWADLPPQSVSARWKKPYAKPV